MSQLCKILTLFALIATLPSPIQASRRGLYEEPEVDAAPPADQSQIEDLDYYAPSPSPYADDYDMSPESQHTALDSLEAEEDYSSPSPAPSYVEDYYYDSPSEAPEAEDYYYDFPSEAPEAEDYYYDSPSQAPQVEDYYYDSPSEAPKVEDYYYDSPSEAPSRATVSYSLVSSEAPAGSIMADPQVTEFSYRAEDDAAFSSEEYDEEGYGEEKRKEGAIGLVFGAVCLVGLGGLVYKRRKSQKRKQPVYVQLSRSTGEV